ncbi:MAG: conjugal transfer protein TraF [Candidatus Paceibacterota bacterium]
MAKTALLTVAVVFVMAMGNAYGEEWLTYGPKAQAMGGASVALPDATNAHYYNPAALAKNKKIGPAISVATGTAAEGDVLGAVDAIAKTMEGIDWPTLSAKIDGGQSLTPTEIQQLLKLFGSDMTGLNKPAQGVLFNLASGASITIGNMGFFVNYFVDGGADPVFDIGGLSLSADSDIATQVSNVVGAGNDRTGSFTNTGSQTLADSIFTGTTGIFTQNQAEELVYQAELAGIDTSDPAIASAILQIASTTGGIYKSVATLSKATTTTATASNNQSGLYMSGIFLKELGVSYGRPVIDNLLSVGANFKVMEGETYYNFIKFDQLQSGTNTLEDIVKRENIKATTTFGLDVSALVSLTEMVQAGLIIRNLNGPTFKFDGPGDFKLDPQIRLGVGVNLINRLKVALDYDVTKNKSMVLNGYESQFFGMGAEIDLWVLNVRAGMMKNLASSGSGPVMTGGIGLGLGQLIRIDLGGSLATDTSTVGSGANPDTIPQRASIAFQASIKF